MAVHTGGLLVLVVSVVPVLLFTDWYQRLLSRTSTYAAVYAFAGIAVVWRGVLTVTGTTDAAFNETDVTAGFGFWYGVAGGAGIVGVLLLRRRLTRQAWGFIVRGSAGLLAASAFFFSVAHELNSVAFIAAVLATGLIAAALWQLPKLPPRIDVSLEAVSKPSLEEAPADEDAAK